MTGLSGTHREVSFKYTETFANHILYRHEVDDHNNLRHEVPPIESTWINHRWVKRVFEFFFAVTEVNIFLDIIVLLGKRNMSQHCSNFGKNWLGHSFIMTSWRGKHGR